MTLINRVARLEHSGDYPMTEDQLDAAIAAAWMSELKAARESDAYRRDFEALLDEIPGGRQGLADDPSAWIEPFFRIHERDHGEKICKGGIWIHRDDYLRLREKLLRERKDRAPDGRGK